MAGLQKTLAICIALLGLNAPILAAAQTTRPQSSAAAPWDIGTVIDFRGDMPRVLATTPGSAGDRIGLQTGDRIRAINGEILRGRASSTNFSRAIAASQGQVDIEILREGTNMRLSGKLDDAMPAQRKGCGFVTTAGSTPRNTASIFPAEITMIDGKTTPLFPVNRHALSPGRHVLVVDEDIDEDRFTGWQLKQRETVRNRLRDSARKVVVLDVVPNTRYHLGARLLAENLDTTDIREGTYWEPVVWRTQDQACP